MSRADERRWDLRFGEELIEVTGDDAPDFNSLWSLGRSVDAKLRQEGLRGGVVSPDGVESMIVFLHFSQIPEVEVMLCLHVLQMATVVEDALSRLLL